MAEKKNGSEKAEKGSEGKETPENPTVEELNELSEEDLDTLLNGDKGTSKKEDSGSKKKGKGHSDSVDDDATEREKELQNKIDKLEKQVADKDSHYQKRENDLNKGFNERYKHLEGQMQQLTKKVNTEDAEDRTSKKMDDLNARINKLRERLDSAEGPVRYEYEDQIDELKVQRQKLRESASQSDKKAIDERITEVATEKYLKAYRQAIEKVLGKTLTDEDVEELKAYQKEHDLPTLINAAYEKNNHGGDPELKEKYDALKKTHEELVESIKAARKSRKKLDDEDSAQDKGKSGSDESYSKKDGTRERIRLGRQGDQIFDGSDPELESALENM